MMRHFAAALAALLAPLLAPSDALAGRFNGPLISVVNTDRASYRPGALAAVIVELDNRTGATFGGSVTVTVTSRGNQIATDTQSVPATAAGTGRTLVPFSFVLPNIDLRGYHVHVRAVNEAAATVDTAGSSLEVATDWTRFPRQCFVSNFAPGVDAAAVVRNLNLWKCNALQLYDVNDTHHIPYSDAATWKNLAGADVSAATVRSYLQHARAYGMLSFNYNLIYGVYPQAFTDGSGVKLAWGDFVRDCKPGCAVSDLFRTPAADGGTFPGNWEAPYLAILNPANPDWRAYWIEKQRPLLANFAYDGLQLDTLGNPGEQWDAAGNRIDLGAALVPFTNAAKRALRTRVVLNNVSRWAEADVALRSESDIYYAELHPEFNDTPFFPSVNGAVAQVRKFTTKGINFPGYLQTRKSNNPACISGGGTTPCFFNPASIRYADTTFLAAGAYHMWFADFDRAISNIFVPGGQLGIDPPLMQAMLDIQSFGVAYENLLRDGVFDVAPQEAGAASVTGSTPAMATGTSGTVGEVWMLPKVKAGFQILHMLNYSQANTINWENLDGTQAPPTGFGAHTVKMYYGGTINPSTHKLWLASPDIDHGRAIQLAYTTGFDGVGTFVTTTVPSLLYWNMLWLETTGLTGSDYAINPRAAIPATSYTEASQGISATAGVLGNGAQRRWAKYPQMAFGTTSPSRLLLTVGASVDSSVEVRLDRPDGPLVASGPVAATGGLGSFAQARVPVANATGTRDVFIVFPERVLTLLDFRFE